VSTCAGADRSVAAAIPAVSATSVRRTLIGGCYIAAPVAGAIAQPAVVATPVVLVGLVSVAARALEFVGH
jgi:hypothetical protein